MAKFTGAEIIAPTHQQRYAVDPATYTDLVRKWRDEDFKGKVDFGDWEGDLLLFPPDGGERQFVP